MNVPLLPEISNSTTSLSLVKVPENVTDEARLPGDGPEGKSKCDGAGHHCPPGEA